MATIIKAAPYFVFVVLLFVSLYLVTMAARLGEP